MGRSRSAVRSSSLPQHGAAPATVSSRAVVAMLDLPRRGVRDENHPTSRCTAAPAPLVSAPPNNKCFRAPAADETAPARSCRSPAPEAQARMHPRPQQPRRARLQRKGQRPSGPETQRRRFRHGMGAAL